jgi:hypothetical protein
MAVITTGSTVYGMRKGMGVSLAGSVVAPSITYVLGNPDAVVTCVNGSDIAIDTKNGKYYISKTTGGSTWYNLISGT